MEVILSNDDSIFSPGIRALAIALKESGHTVTVQAPMRQQSGVSHAITVFQPLQRQLIRAEGFEGMGIFGTPADCVKLALALRETPPDLVIAGINLGRNVGSDVFYSGTIGAASEGAQACVPSLAVSHANNQASWDELLACSMHLAGLLVKIDWNKLAKRRVININYPAVGLASSKGLRICPQAQAIWLNAYELRKDPRAEPYWWMTGDMDRDSILPDTDIDLLARGYITVTPLQFEHTDQAAMDSLELMELTGRPSMQDSLIKK